MATRVNAPMRWSRLLWLALLAGGAALAGCGEGRAIFNVDVLSFLITQGDSTVPYALPGGASATIDTSAKVTVLKGLGNSTVDSATLVVGTIVQNDSGTGKVKFQFFFSDSLATLFTGTPYVQDSVNVSGMQADTLTLGPIDFVSDSLFAHDQIYAGVRLAVSSAPGSVMGGRLKLSEIRLRIVLQDHVFQ